MSNRCIAMVELLAVPSGVKLQVCGSLLVQANPLHPPTTRRFCCLSCKDESMLSKPPKLMVSQRKILRASPRWNTRISCSYFSAVADAGGSMASEWIPFADQLLLIASVTLTYMTGVIPFQKSSSDTQVRKPIDDVVTENPSSVMKESDINLLCTWDVVKGKLLDSLTTINSGIIPSETLGDLEGSCMRQPSNLSAIAEGPRIRLLWSSFQQLNREVRNISSEAGKKVEDFGSVFAAVVQNCCQPLWMAWLEKELTRAPTVSDKDFLSIAGSKINGYERIIQNIRMSGKEELYAELVYMLKFGGLRKGSYYTSNVFIQHGVEILEDILIMLADGIASMYLELISVDCGLPIHNDMLGLSLCTLSTRALQKMRNEVALHQWLHQNMQAVVSMFEDQFDLWTFESQPFLDRKRNNIKNPGWWGLKTKRSPPTTLHWVIIKNLSIRVRRTKELRALTGWRYYFSLLLELADITMPFVRTATSKVRDAISFFLVSLVGRFLGLIFSGIRNALRLK